MLLAEPPRTAYDLHFNLLGVPVRVHPWFWLISLFMGMGPGAESEPAFVALWVAASFVSVLIHEMGHALVIRYFGARPWITLYGMGGLASSNESRRAPRNQILVSLAGPFAGFAFFGLVLALIAATGHRVKFDPGSLPYLPVRFGTFDNVRMWQLCWILAIQNFYFNLLNLLPIFPLDGGQVSRELFQMADYAGGLRRSLLVSFGVAAAVAVYSLAKSQSLFMTMFFGFLAYESYQALQRFSPGRGRGGGW